jgi:TetR/AcrR family transcriptional regulator, mexJK operon transcriptional repressor
MTAHTISRRGEANRDRIRQAAQEVFLERGFADASMDAITAHAGVSKQTVYAYYSSKADLFVAVLRRLTLENPQNQLLLQIDQLDPASLSELREVLTVLAHEIAQTMMQPEYQALLRLILAESARGPQTGELFRSTVPDLALNRLVGLFERAERRGLIRVIDRDVTARLLLGPLLTYAVLDGLLAASRPPAPIPPERVDEIVRLVLHAIAEPEHTKGVQQ